MTQPYSMVTTNNNPFNIEHAKMNQAIISGLGATRTLLEEESGSLILLDRAAGIVLTLPAPKIGMSFDFVVSVSVTSNNYKIITDAGTTFLVGGILSNDTDTSGAAVFFAANGTTHIALTSNGSTTGGLIGSRFRATCISLTQWLIEGINNGSGTVATPMATS